MVSAMDIFTVVAARVLARRGIGLLAGGRGVEVLQHHHDRVLLVEDRVGHARGEPRVPEAAVAQDRDHAPPEIGGHRARGGHAHPVAQDRVALVERRQRGEGVAADVGGHVRLAELALGDLERAEDRPLRAAGTERGRALGQRRLQERASLAHVLGEHLPPPLRVAAQEAREGGQHHLGHVLALRGHHVLAVDARGDPVLVGQRLQLLLDEARHAFLEHEHALLALEEGDELLGHERMDHVEDEQRDAGGAERVGHPQELESPQRGRGETALEDDAERLLLAGDHLVETALDDVAPGRGQPPLELLRLLGVGGRRVAQAAVVERVPLERRVHRDGRPDIVPADQAPAHVRGPDAQADHGGQVGGLGQPEALFHHAREVLERRARVDQRQRRLEREGVRALLDDAGAGAVVLAHHDQGAADDAGRGQVRQRVGGHVGAHDGLPRHRAPHRVVDGRTEERGGRRLVGGGVQVDAHGLQERLVGVGQDVEEVRDRRARIPAHVGDAGLQQRLRDGEDPLAPEHLPVAQRQLLDFLGERPFHRTLLYHNLPEGGAHGALHHQRRRPDLLRITRYRRAAPPRVRHRRQRRDVAAQYPGPLGASPADPLGAAGPRPVGEPGRSHQGHLRPLGARPARPA